MDILKSTKHINIQINNQEANELIGLLYDAGGVSLQNKNSIVRRTLISSINNRKEYAREVRDFIGSTLRRFIEQEPEDTKEYDKLLDITKELDCWINKEESK